MPNGCVDLTFYGSRKKLDALQTICEWFNEHGLPELCAQPAEKAAVFRINEPELHYRKGFEGIPKNDLDECFMAVNKLVGVARFLKNVQLFFG